MNIIRKVIKETLLTPLRVVQGTWDAIDEAVNGKPTSGGGREDKKGS